jgi:tetratricopeptide (TPR) repeat protein
MVSATLRRALALHQAGRLGEAEAGYRQALSEEPGSPEALHFLGLVAYQFDRPAEAVDLIARAIAIRPNPIFWYNLGHAYFALKDYPAAENAFRQSVVQAPAYAEALFHLGNMHRARNDTDGAAHYYRRAVAAKPDFADAHANLGLLLNEMGDAHVAIKHLEDAHRLRPEDAKILVNLGVVRMRVSSYQAITDFQRALSLEPGHADATLNLAKVLSWNQRHGEAIEYYQAALARDPGNENIRIALASSLAETNRFEEAARHYEMAAASKPSSAEPLVTLGNLYRRFGRFEDGYQYHLRARQLDPENCDALAGILRYMKSRVSPEETARIGRLADSPSMPHEKRRHLHFALAECKDSGGDYDAAFYHMDRGNELRRVELEPQNGPYDPEKEAAAVDRIIAAFDDRYFSRTRTFGIATKLPVFVVGMPRSGTTLCEQILASHSRIHGAGELTDIGRYVDELRRAGSTASENLENTGYAAHLTANTVQSLATRHLSRLEALAPGAMRVVDKMPMNYFHLGFIATLFPAALVIHCRRDAMDIGLSCYSKDFDRVAIWASDLRAIGHVYRQYVRLMHHWRRVCPLRMLELQYEDVVTDLEGSARRLIDFCGLEWEDGCLRFHETARMVKTASLEQVRRPVYDSSVGRWHKYEKHLAPLWRALNED